MCVRVAGRAVEMKEKNVDIFKLSLESKRGNGMEEVRKEKRERDKDEQK